MNAVFHWMQRLPMARIRTSTLLSTLLVLVLLGASGCSAFFDFNLFSSLDKPAVPDPSRYESGSSGLDNLKADLSSPAIVNALKGSPSTVSDIQLYLVGTYNVTTAVTAGDGQVAAVLYGDLALKSTSGDVLVNNIVSTLITNPSGNLQSMLSSIVPADVAADQTKFSNMVSGLLAAELAYIALGHSIPPSPPGINLGDVAQKAAVSLMMKTIFDAATAQVGSGNELTDLFALVNNQPSGGLDAVSISDPFSGLSSGNPSWLKAIFDAAGAPYPG